MGKTIKKIALESYPKNKSTEDTWVEYLVKKGYDFNKDSRECFCDGFDRCLKELHAWACAKYNEAEAAGNRDKMKSFQEMKRYIMSMSK